MYNDHQCTCNNDSHKNGDWKFVFGVVNAIVTAVLSSGPSCIEYKWSGLIRMEI